MKFRIIKRKEIIEDEIVGTKYKYAFQVLKAEECHLKNEKWEFVDLCKDIGSHRLIPAWYSSIESCKSAAECYAKSFALEKEDKIVEEFEL